MKYLRLFNTFNESNQEYDFMMLGRLQMDCDYFLGNGNGSERVLWAGSVEGQIAKMKELWQKLSEKPEWLSYEDIENYEKKMLSVKNKLEDVII